jgi:glutamate dehydrogenase
MSAARVVHWRFRGFLKRGAECVTNPGPQRSTARAGEERARNLEVFGARLFKRLSNEAEARLSPQERLDIVRDAYDFFAERPQSIKAGVGTVRAGAEAVTVVRIAMPDCAFIVDSWRAYLQQTELHMLALLHPIFSVARDAGGRLISLEEGSARETRESFVEVIFETELDAAAAVNLAAELEQRMHEVLAATTDFPKMTARALQICDELAAVRELVEVREFLRWLVGGSFLFLGYQRYIAAPAASAHAFVPEEGSALGILRENPEKQGRVFDTIESFDQELLQHGPLLIVSKSHLQSNIHRLEPMDDILIRRSGAHGRTTAVERFLGLFSSKAAAEEAEHVPILRDKLRQLLEEERLLPGSHDYKELVAAFNSLPKEELFRASVRELRQELDAIIGSFGETDVRVTILPDPARRMVVVMVLLPRERFSTDVRVQIQQLLAHRLEAQPVYYHLELREGYSAHLHFCFAAGRVNRAIFPALQAEIAALTRTWNDRLREQLLEKFGEPHGEELAARYRSAFPAEYRATTEVQRAIADIEQVEAALAGGTACVEFCPPLQGAAASQIRIFQAHEPIVLSDLMPLLQNFGIRVLSEDAHELRPSVGGRVEQAFVLTFQVEAHDGRPLQSCPGATLLAEALSAVRSGLAENDQLNSLTLSAALGWREVALLRAYLAAAFQMKLAPARPALRRVFLAHPHLARQIVDLFVARMHPERDAAPADLARMKAAYIEALAAVDNITDDRVARRVLAMVEATVRTNYFQPLSHPVPRIVLKFESARIDDLPDTPPLYEIHVDTPRMQGCHLRAGKVARGGIRWSDRLDDFRTEILDLMKTQTVKNAIIVPVGAKGGFVIKSEGRVPAPQEVVDAYNTLIGSMLDLTDNIVDGQVVHPPRVKVLDDDGPYLVVAADKGTAAFSDIANGLAQERGFWLGDAFASGGTYGYDHKKLGITARGAWESARRHLREMGRDLEHGAPVTMAGIGDMSGDVFGNGLLQSANVKLLAAFDHRHIFLDPDPDPARSYAERKRLYELPRSQWSDYNPELISAGGGVFRRGQKVIPISPQVRAALRIDAAELDSDSLIKAILRADVDLLYNGGIGTYVRAADETDALVGDHANDACRIVASELRAKVVVEGGNLGLTQKARIEFALRGGRINTDAIDNSAGVDLSDHEVNLKVLMAPALARRALTFDQRNAALKDAADEVAEQVLSDNRDQVLLLSLEQLRSRTHARDFREHLTAIEQRGLLRRDEEALPTLEALRERHARFAGLTRPELALVVAYTKLDLNQRLQQSALVSEPYLMERYLRPYFPSSIARRFSDEIPQHRLRRELVATQLVNELVDTMGATFVFELVRDCGAAAEEVVRAWLIASECIGLRAAFQRIKTRCRELMVEAEMRALMALARAGAGATRVVLSGPLAALQLEQAIGRLPSAFADLAGQFENFLAGGERERFERYYRELRTAGLAEADAHQLARLDFADHLIEIIRVALELDVPPPRAAEVFFTLAEPIDFSLMENAIRAVDGADRWERRAAQELNEGLLAARLRLTRTLLAGNHETDRAGLLQRLSGLQPDRLQQAQQVLAEVRTLPSIGLAPLLVAVRSVILLSLPQEPSGQALDPKRQARAELLPR